MEEYWLFWAEPKDSLVLVKGEKTPRPAGRIRFDDGCWIMRFPGRCVPLEDVESVFPSSNTEDVDASR
jgi:hypothetical protein